MKEIADNNKILRNNYNILKMRRRKIYLPKENRLKQELRKLKEEFLDSAYWNSYAYRRKHQKEFQERNIQRLYVMPYIRGYERIHGLNKFAVYRYGWDNEKQDSTTEIRIASMKIKRWVRLEEPLRI